MSDKNQKRYQLQNPLRYILSPLVASLITASLLFFGCTQNNSHSLNNENPVTSTKNNAPEKIANIKYSNYLNEEGKKLFKKNEFEQAIIKFSEALKYTEENLGKVHMATSITLSNLAYAYFATKNHFEAQQKYMQALRVREALLYNPDEDSAFILMMLAKTSFELNAYQDSENYALQASGIQDKLFGSTHIKTANSFLKIATCNTKMQRYQRAELFFKKTLEIQEKHYGKNDMKLKETLEALSALYRITNQLEKNSIIQQKINQISTNKQIATQKQKTTKNG